MAKLISSLEITCLLILLLHAQQTDSYDTATHKVVLYIKDPCEALKEAQEKTWSSIPMFQDFDMAERDGYNEMHMRHCRYHFKNKLQDVMSRLKMCTHRRYKRSITGLVIGKALEVMTLGVTNFVVSRFDDVIDAGAAAVEYLCDSAARAANKMLRGTDDSVEERMHDVEAVSALAQYHHEDLDGLVKTIPNMIWSSAHVHNEIIAGVADLRVVAKRCRDGKLATREMGELLDSQDLAAIHEEDTEILEMYVDDDSNKIEVIFMVHIHHWYDFIVMQKYWIAAGILSLISLILACRPSTSDRAPISPTELWDRQEARLNLARVRPRAQTSRDEPDIESGTTVDNRVQLAQFRPESYLDFLNKKMDESALRAARALSTWQPC